MSQYVLNAICQKQCAVPESVSVPYERRKTLLRQRKKMSGL